MVFVAPDLRLTVVMTSDPAPAQSRDGHVDALHALLDQHLVAGLGNIYVCETLYRARIHPARKAARISAARAAALVPLIRDVLAEAITAGGSSLRDYVRPDGQLGYFAKQWRVYGRQGETCPCGGTVERVVQSGRSTFWCRSCQK